jgi:REP element-mobilizing transposase RayT
MLAATKIIRFRRFHGYDYSRGAVMFITFGISSRRHVFGEVNGSKVAYSPAGLAALETFQLERMRNPDLTVHSFVIMPDHVHLRIHVRPGASEPLKAVGKFVNNFKRWTKWKAAKLGVAIDWQANYHDRLCLNAEVIDLVDKYIANNPLKWSLMHGPNPPLKVHEPLDCPWLPDGEWWTGVGNVDLLGADVKLAAFRLSRSIPRRDFAPVVAKCLAAVEKGYVPASTFISPCERALKDALAAAGAPMVRVVPDPLATVYRPKEDEPGLFAAGRLLLLSRVAAAGMSRSAAWHEINDVLAGIACNGGGAAAYVRGRGDWRFARPAEPA